MSGKIYSGQPITLKTTWSDEIEDITTIAGATIVYYYWYPDNSTTTPSGSVSGSIVSATDCTSTGEIPAAANTEARAGAANSWRVQGKIALSGDTFAEYTTSFRTYLDGT